MNGHEGIVKMLLEREGVDPDQADVIMARHHSPGRKSADIRE